MAATVKVDSLPMNMKKLWDDMLSNLSTLSSFADHISVRNAELESRIAELEYDLSVHKQAIEIMRASPPVLNRAQDPSYRSSSDSKNLDTIQTTDSLILCVINGSNNVFNPSLVLQGQHGGRIAAQTITRSISQYLSGEKAALGRPSFWTTFYYDRRKLLSSISNGIAFDDRCIDAFLMGFSEVSPRFQTVDVGVTEGESDKKIQEYIHTFIRFPQTLRIFYAGGSREYDLNLIHTLDEKSFSKLVFVECPQNDSQHLRFFQHKAVQVQGLFIPRRTVIDTNNPMPLTPASSTYSGSKGFVSPDPSPKLVYGQVIDASLPLHKQSPPPCNEHYLMSCSKGSACKYSHDYILTPEQLVELRVNAKKAPCNWIKNGLRCPYGSQCCWGHICPNGPNCFHFGKGKCWFKGDCMHIPLSTPL